jgi:dephospho-CoA kinase
MGKSTAAEMFRRLGVPVHDADAVVHGALGPAGLAVSAVSAAFPEARNGDQIDRQKLGAIVFGDTTNKDIADKDITDKDTASKGRTDKNGRENGGIRELERILHPLVAASTTQFLRRWARARRALVVLDVPLLFEAGRDQGVDGVLVMTAPAFLQRQRVLARPGMTAVRFEKILASQMSDSEKRARADFVISSGLGKPHTFSRISCLTRFLRGGACHH